MTRNEILRNDGVISNVVVSVKEVYSSIYQKDVEQTTITKDVYKIHDEVFNLNRRHNSVPTMRCVFTLHTDKRSSFVQIFDRTGNLFFSGNSLWSGSKHDSYDAHLDFIKLLHSTTEVIQKYSC